MANPGSILLSANAVSDLLPYSAPQGAEERRAAKRRVDDMECRAIS